MDKDSALALNKKLEQSINYLKGIKETKKPEPTSQQSSSSSSSGKIYTFNIGDQTVSIDLDPYEKVLAVSTIHLFEMTLQKVMNEFIERIYEESSAYSSRPEKWDS